MVATANSYEVIENAGHLPVVERPEAFTAAVARALTRDPLGAPSHGHDRTRCTMYMV